MSLSKFLKYKFMIILVISLLFLISWVQILAAATVEDPLVKIGNITRIKGIRDNQLIGYGLVIGLAGSGDSNRSEATIKSVANMLGDFGIEVTPGQIRSRNLAAVMVTANLPPFASNGDRIDVTVSSIGDARSLQGGTLLMTPLKAANDEIYAVAQGAISIGGYNIQGGGAAARENHANAGRMPNGAIVEKELKINLDREQIVYLLGKPSFEAADAIAGAVNKEFELSSPARAVNAGEVQITVPSSYRNDVVDFIAMINQIEVRSNVSARIVINEKTGTIVISHNVRLSTVAVAHGNITVTITTSEQVSQPPSFSEGETEVIEETEIKVEEEEGHITLVEGDNTIRDLVKALNAIGATPRDLIAILQAIKAQGALHAELVLQ